MIDPKNDPSPTVHRRLALPGLTRRDVLTLAWKGLLLLGSLLGLDGLLRYLDYQSTPNEPSVFDLGLPAQYPSGSRTFIAQAKAVLVHTSTGFIAYSLVCPHLGCEVNIVGDGFACPCHGSRFDPNGKLTHGPATKGLRALKLAQNDQGHLILATK
jgi:cytochrome b6-f complex iron-sulfur subunit